MKRRLRLLLSLVLIISGLVGCNIEKKENVNSNSKNIETEYNKDNKNASNSEEIKLTKTITSTDGSITIKVPNDWEELTGQLNDDAIIEVGSEKEYHYLAIIAEKKENFNLPLAKSNFTLSEYDSLVLENTASAVTLDFETKSSPNTIGSYSSLFSKIYANVDGLNIAYSWNNMESNQYFVQVISWTSKSKAEESEKLFKDIANTIVVNE